MVRGRDDPGSQLRPRGAGLQGVGAGGPRRAGRAPARPPAGGRPAARGAPAYKESVQAALAEQTEHLHFLPPVAGLGEVTPETIEVAVAEGVLGNAEPEEALTPAQDKAQQLLEEVLQRYGSGA